MSIFGKIKTTTKDDQINFDALQKKLNAIKYISEFVVSGENIDDVLNAINKTIPSVLEVNFILIFFVEKFFFFFDWVIEWVGHP